MNIRKAFGEIVRDPASVVAIIAILIAAGGLVRAVSTPEPEAAAQETASNDIVPKAIEALPPPSGVPLVSHKAQYRVKLLRATGTKSPTSARGGVAYEFVGNACDGYAQVFRQVTEIQPAEGAQRLSDMRSATFEDGTGSSFNFDVKTTVDNNAPDIVDGHANKTGNDVLAITLSKPASKTADVPSEVLFPTAHLRRIIATAKAGQKILSVRVFDGSDSGTKVYDTTTIIGRAISGRADDPGTAKVPALDGVTRWPVSISYFELGKMDEGPAYTLGFELYENGISRALRFDYGDFVLAGEMTELQLLPTKGCGK